MGVAASLFFSSSSADKETLHRRVRPTDVQFEEQQARWNELAEAIVVALKEATGLPIRTWLQGSYKLATQIRPVRMSEEFDIDLGVYFEWAGEPHDGGHTPEDLKAQVQTALKNFAKGRSEVRSVLEPAKPRCARIRYDGNFHIDVPAYHLDAKRDARALATESNGWEWSDPKALVVWFQQKFDEQERQKVCRYIRYFKTWAALKLKDGEGRPPSVLITVLVAEAAEGVGFDNLASDDDAMYLVAKEISNRLADSFVVANPVDTSEDLAGRLSDDEREAFADALETFVKTASKATDATDVITAADEWTKLFEHMFPFPEEEEITESLFKGQLVPLSTTPEVSVVAKARKNSSFVWRGQNSIGPIPKDCTIFFTVDNAHQFPYGTAFEWMVRNQGREADDVNDLGHKVLSFGATAEETSAYNGKHYMDCVAKRGNQIIGFRRVPVTIAGVAVPARNPPRKMYPRVAGRR